MVWNSRYRRARLMNGRRLRCGDLVVGGSGPTLPCGPRRGADSICRGAVTGMRPPGRSSGRCPWRGPCRELRPRTRRQPTIPGGSSFRTVFNRGSALGPLGWPAEQPESIRGRPYGTTTNACLSVELAHCHEVAGVVIPEGERAARVLERDVAAVGGAAQAVVLIPRTINGGFEFIVSRGQVRNNQLPDAV